MSTAYIDTSVLLAAAGEGEAEASRRVVAAIGDGRLDGVVSAEVLQELLHMASWRQSRAQGLLLADLAGKLFPHARPVSAGTVLRAAELLRTIPRLGTRIAIHAAAMAEAGVQDVVSLDPEFGLVSGIRRLDPTDAVATYRI